MWTRFRPALHGLGYWRTYDKDEIKAFKESLEKEKSECIVCINGTPVHHTWCSANDEFAASYQCRSFSRWYNPESGQWEGRAHCTCDSCF